MRLISARLSLSLCASRGCGRAPTGAAEVAPPVQKLRISAGVPTGTFGPFSDSFVRGYAGLMPDLHFELIDAPGSVRNLEALAKME